MLDEGNVCHPTGNSSKHGNGAGHTASLMSEILTKANPSGTSHTSLLQKQMSFRTSVGSSGQHKTEEFDIVEVENFGRNSTKYGKGYGFTWVCCAPCIWLRTSTAVHKIAITTATLLVTGLLVASPILFLISTAPSQLPKDCFMDEHHCSPSTLQASECNHAACRTAALTIQTRINWSYEPCYDFKNFACFNPLVNIGVNSLKTMRSAQETVDSQMQSLLEHNTTTGMFRKVGRLFSSCLRQTTNSSTIFLLLQQLGGYLPIGALGPSNLAPLLSKIHEYGPTPIIDLYYDLSYGRKPQILLIISGSTSSSPILENIVRWKGPRSPTYKAQYEIPKLLGKLLDIFLPQKLSLMQKESEKQGIETFIKELNKLKVENSRRGFWNSSVFYNISDIQIAFPFVEWQQFIPAKWKGPIVVRNAEYLKAVQELLSKYPTRVAHNSLLLLSALEVLPKGIPTASICTKATMWALPELTSALYLAQQSSENIDDAVKRTEVIFKSLKAHLKRAPSLKGTALVKLSALKIRCKPWEGFQNITKISENINSIDITSDNWFENVLRIYKKRRSMSFEIENNADIHDTWAYPIVSKIFYDTLSHSIVVPLSVILVPYFSNDLPPYLQYASVGVAIAKEVLRSITKTFEDKALSCVPPSVSIFSNDSRMDILIHSGGMQISYHSMLALTGPIKGMSRLPGLNLTPSQIFFIVSAQELCSESNYSGIETETLDFQVILSWLIAQGGSANEVFKCAPGSPLFAQKTCNIF